MKNLIVATSLLAASFVHSADMIPARIITHCGNSLDVISMQAERFNEEPIIMGEAVVTDSDNSQITGTMVLWMNDEGTFSVTFTPQADANITCYVITGGNVTEIQ